MKSYLYILLFSVIPLTFAKADTTACIFDWAEAAAPSLISSSVKTENIPYGDFTLRYYDKTQNALLVDESTKELLFYDVSSYLKGEEELEIGAAERTANLQVSVRQYVSTEDELGAELTFAANEKNSSSIRVSDRLSANKDFPFWTEERSFILPFKYIRPISQFTIETITDSPFEIVSISLEGVALKPDEVNFREVGGEIRPYWVNSRMGINFSTERVSKIQELGNQHYWSVASDCYKSGDPITVRSTSYLEAHAENKKPVDLPSFLNQGWQPHSWEQADFLQNGTEVIVAGTLAKSVFDLSYYEQDPIGEIYFFSRVSADDQWVDITDLLLSDSTGCVIPRKTLVADFNNDERPDVVFTCHGLDFGYSYLKDRGFEKGEVNRILLSRPDGRYDNKVLTYDGNALNCFCHGGAAGDINNDGYVDVLLNDGIYGEWINGEFKKWEGNVSKMHILLGDGTGNFTLRNDLPRTFDGCCYYSSDLYDFNGDGFLDIWASGGAPHGEYKERNIIAYSREGQFFEEDIVDLPNDGKHTFSGDMLVHGGYVYLGGINIDFSKDAYYWGYAITKIPLDGSDFEIIYEHEGLYEDSCDPNGWRDSWIKWLLIDDGYIVPKQDCKGHNFKVPL